MYSASMYDRLESGSDAMNIHVSVHSPVLKAGHPLSCSSVLLQCMYVVCLVCIVWFVGVRFLSSFLFS